MTESIDFKIRTFRPGDQHESRELILSGLASHFGVLEPSLNQDLDDIWTTYISSGYSFIVAEHSSKIIGTAALIVESDTAARIARVAVSSMYRRKRIGLSLVNYLIAEAKRSGFSTINVETNHDWLEAQSLYQKSGFVVSGSDDESIHYQLDL